MGVAVFWRTFCHRPAWSMAALSRSVMIHPHAWHTYVAISARSAWSGTSSLLGHLICANFSSINSPQWGHGTK